eukprot:SM000024S07766  [mRNA]  locus=s24:325094:327146:- [translate_table: standard]
MGTSSGTALRPDAATLAAVLAGWAAVWHLLAQHLHLVLLLVARSLLRAADAAHVGSLLCLVGLSSVSVLATEAAERLPTKDTLPREAAVAAGPGRPGLLPPKAPSNRQRLTIVLDLDETLVCAYNSAGLPPSVHQNALKSGVSWFQLQCFTQEMDAFGIQKVNNVTVYERPGLREFLEKTSRLGELVLFTAGLEGYARPLVDKIDPQGYISSRLYRPATVSTRFREHVKDLSFLGRDLQRTVLVDNNPFSFIMQPLNGIPCVPFTGEQAGDSQLLDVLLPLLEQLSQQPDIRPMLLHRFRMPSWFRNRGIPTMDWLT